MMIKLLGRSKNQETSLNQFFNKIANGITQDEKKDKTVLFKRVFFVKDFQWMMYPIKCS